MLRKRMIERGMGKETDFRMRGGEVSRIEGFSDAVFVFAVTLLVVSLEVPKTFDELAATMRGFAAFAICFTFLFVIWNRHYQFFRRCGLDDGYTKVLTAALLFVVLFYTYPLKFLFSLLVEQFTGHGTNGGSHGAGGGPTIELAQLPALMTIYGAGYAAVMLVFLLMYIHAWRRRAELQLDPFEASLTRASMEGYALELCVPLASILVAEAGGVRWCALAGWMYILIGPPRALHGWFAGRHRRRIASAVIAG